MLKSTRQMPMLCLILVAGSALLGVPPTIASANLPDQRGYELVSPADKNGGDVMASATRTRAAISGGAINFTSLTSFGDALGSGAATEYIAQRRGLAGTSGWSTHSITPRIDALSLTAAAFSKDTAYQEFSLDLSVGVVHSLTPQTNAPNVEHVSNIYRRDDILAPGAGMYRLLSDSPTPLSDPFFGYRPAVAAGTPDMARFTFEANRNLTADAPPQPPGCAAPFFFGCSPRLYEWDQGTVRLAGILPDGTGATRSIAGAGVGLRHYALNSISEDGSKIFFAVPPSNGDPSGELYMRADNGLPSAFTVQLNASERTPDPDPAGPQPATYQAASADGSKVFFSSTEQLTDAPGQGLYMYDTTRPANDPDNLTLIEGPGVADVFGGVGRDASYVYFVANGDVTLPQPLGIYVWHAGVVTPIGSIPDIFGNALGASTSWVIRPLNARVSADGTTLLFTANSGAGLTGYDHGNTCASSDQTGHGPCSELYLYRADGHTLVCVSCNPSGAPATSDATFNIRVGTSAAGTSTYLNHTLSDDGDRVLFETGERLVPEDINGKHSDVYEYDVPTASLHLISTGTSTDDSHFLDATPSGSDVFFTTNQQILGWDVDNRYDLYDARIGGGFPEPATSAAECTGDTCQGPVDDPPTAARPTTSTVVVGSDNLKGSPHAKKQCAKGKVRKRVHGKARCVKKKSKKAHRANR